MTQALYRETLERIRAIAGTCGGVVTREQIRQAAWKADPHISLRQLEELTADCQRSLQVVSHKEYEEVTRRLRPEKGRPAPDPALIDRFFRSLLDRRMSPEVRACWEQRLSPDPRYLKILQARATTAPAQLAEDLGISPEALYFLEREMIKLYHTIKL